MEQQEVALTETARLALSVNSKHREVQRLGRTAKELAAEIGEELIAVKAELKHGEFIPWVEQNCAFTPQHGRRYIKVAEAKTNTRVPFDACSSIREVLAIGKPKAAPKPETRAATLDDLRKVEKLRALRDDPATPDAQRKNIDEKLRKIEAEIGPVDPPKSKGQSQRMTARRTACEIMDRLSPIMKPKVRSSVIRALVIAYGDDPQKLDELLAELNTPEGN